MKVSNSKIFDNLRKQIPHGYRDEFIYIINNLDAKSDDELILIIRLLGILFVSSEERFRKKIYRLIKRLAMIFTTAILLFAFSGGIYYHFNDDKIDLIYDITELKKSKNKLKDDINKLESKLYDKKKSFLANKAWNEYNLTFSDGDLFAEWHKRDLTDKKTYSKKIEKNKTYIRIGRSNN